MASRAIRHQHLNMVKRLKGTVHPIEQTHTARPSKGASSTASKVANMDNTMLAIPRDSQDTSKSSFVSPQGLVLTFPSGSPPPQDPRSGYGPPAEQYGQQHQGYGQDPNHPPQHQGGYVDATGSMPPHDPNAPYDPNAPEGERGIMGAVGGGLAGRYAGKQMGGHTFLGMIGGAIAGSKLEDAAKDRYGKHGNGGKHHHSDHGSQGGSSWGGNNYGGGLPRY